jgi:hypothetical protein
MDETALSTVQKPQKMLAHRGTPDSVAWPRVRWFGDSANQTKCVVWASAWAAKSHYTKTVQRWDQRINSNIAKDAFGRFV